MRLLSGRLSAACPAGGYRAGSRVVQGTIISAKTGNG